MGVAPWVFLEPMAPAVNRIVARMAEAEPAKVVRVVTPAPVDIKTGPGPSSGR
jgi:hypothetical protein